MNPKSKEFKALQKEWYKKIKKSGFEDIEDDKEMLKTWALSGWRTRLNPTRNAATAEYYRLAGQFFHDHAFETAFDKAVWELHSEGLSITDIQEKLKAEGFVAYRDKIGSAIRRLREIMVTRARQESTRNR